MLLAKTSPSTHSFPKSHVPLLMITASSPSLLKPTLPIYKHLLISRIKNKTISPTATTPRFYIYCKTFPHRSHILSETSPHSLLSSQVFISDTSLLGKSKDQPSVLNLLSSSLWCLQATLYALRAFLNLALRTPHGPPFLPTPCYLSSLPPSFLLCSVFGPLHFQPQSSQLKALPYILMTPNFYLQPDFSWYMHNCLINIFTWCSLAFQTHLVCTWAICVVF